MKLKKITLSLLSLVCGLYSLQSQAFQVDKMVIVGDEKGNGIITLTNDEDSPLFVETLIDEIKIKDGTEIIKNNYSRENLSDWKISLTHQRLILKQGEEKDIGIRSLCHNTTCDNSQDLMFSLSFLPSKYREEGKEASGVEVNYGFAPVYIIPTTEPVVDYSILNRGSELEVKNNSNTMIQVYLDSCTTEITSQCRQKLTVLAGRHKTFNLIDTIQSDNLRVTVNSHDKSYSKKEVIKRSN
ncbi:hypothetical protein [Vibrio jasicida]|uniref:hypothetical protein n=1 Tax=Vibrio jasicida TaxID=766224 RepID=UPI0003A7527D|nr:hypothetical protein [Vibrio jasicida]